MIRPFGSLSKPSDWRPDKQTVFLVPLSSLDCEVPSVGFDDDTSIRRLTDDEKGRIRGKYSFSLPLTSPEWAVDVRRQGLDFDVLTREAGDKIDHVITALRLLQPGHVSLSSFDSLVYQPELPSPPAHENRQTFAPYLLQREHLSKLRDVFHGLQMDIGPEVKVALGRFNSSYDRPKYLFFNLVGDSPGTADSLIDLWIGLEALFAKKGETLELAYKFSMRIAHFIGQAPDDRENLFNELKKAYAVRSRVVHGEEIKKGMSVPKAEQVTEDALRLSLFRITIQRKVPNLDQLDKKAVRGSA